MSTTLRVFHGSLDWYNALPEEWRRKYSHPMEIACAYHEHLRDSDAKGLVPERSEGPNDSEPVAARASERGIAQQSHPNPPHLVSKEIIDAGNAMREALRHSSLDRADRLKFIRAWDAALSVLGEQPIQ